MIGLIGNLFGFIGKFLGIAFRIFVFLLILGIIESILDAIAKANPDGKLAKRRDKSAAQSGDIDKIASFYGFRKGTVESREYGDILKALNRAQEEHPSDKNRIQEMRATVLYKICGEDDAQTFFPLLTSGEAEFVSNYQSFQEALKTDDFERVQDLANTLQKSDCVKINQNTILGEFYYHWGVVYQNGDESHPKDIKKAKEFYEKAAIKYGYADAMPVLVEFLLAGKIDGVTVKRDYETAFICVLVAVKVGNEEMIRMTKAYGVDGMILRPIQAEAVTYHFRYGYQLTAPVDHVKRMVFQYGIIYKAVAISDEFSENYIKRFIKADGYPTENISISEVKSLYSSCVRKMIDFAVHVLISYGIDEYDDDAIIESSDDLSFETNAAAFSSKLRTINSTVSKARNDINYAKENRGRWTGGGIGTTIGGTIKASIKGSIAAGLMNAGTSALYDLSGNYAENKALESAHSQKRALFGSNKTVEELSEAVKKACCSVGDTLYAILTERSIFRNNGFPEKIIYQGDNLNNIDNRALTAKINNNLALGDSEYLYALLLEKLRRSPFDQETFNQLCEFSKSDLEVIATLEEYAGDFGLNFSI